MTKAEAQAKASPAAADAKKAKAKEAIVVPPMPVKPAYAKPGAAKASQGRSRRTPRVHLRHVGLAIGFTALSATAAAWTLGTVRFMFPNILREPPSRFSVGTPDKFPPGQVEERFKAQFGVWIVNAEYNGQQQIFALKIGLHAPGLHAELARSGAEIQMPLPRQRFLQGRHQLRRPGPAAAGALRDRHRQRRLHRSRQEQDVPGRNGRMERSGEFPLLCSATCI